MAHATHRAITETGEHTVPGDGIWSGAETLVLAENGIDLTGEAGTGVMCTFVISRRGDAIIGSSTQSDEPGQG